MNAPLWRGMDRAALDAGYDNSAAVADSARRLAQWSARSAALRARQPDSLDLPYGPAPRERIDLFRCGARDAPLFVFLHGGYWRRNSKEIFSCMAEGPLAAGFDVALPGYTLAPQASLREIVEQIRAALLWLRREGPARGAAKGRLVVSGWSAGGHLAALAMGWPEVDAGLAISGVFELEPIRLGALNDALGLDAKDAAALSPARNIPAEAGPLTVAWGTGELPELQRQSSDFAALWRARGHAGAAAPLEAENHFSILEQLARPGGRLVRCLEDLR